MNALKSMAAIAAICFSWALFAADSNGVVVSHYEKVQRLGFAGSAVGMQTYTATLSSNEVDADTLDNSASGTNYLAHHPKSTAAPY